MVGKSFNDVVKFLDAALSETGKGVYSEFYVGITDDIDRRLFQEHNVDREKNWWSYTTAATKEIAEMVEQYYLDKGMHGDTGGGTRESRIVYCYKVTPTTIDGKGENG